MTCQNLPICQELASCGPLAQEDQGGLETLETLGDCAGQVGSCCHTEELREEADHDREERGDQRVSGPALAREAGRGQEERGGRMVSWCYRASGHGEVAHARLEHGDQKVSGYPASGHQVLGPIGN